MLVCLDITHPKLFPNPSTEPSAKKRGNASVNVWRIRNWREACDIVCTSPLFVTILKLVEMPSARLDDS
jgi:hypothetical protein